jgi:sugar lactone lactonase YvrE
MNPSARFTRAALAALLLGTGAAAPSARAVPPVPVRHPAPGQRLQWDSKKFMHVSELRPGMRGYALTVFKGTKIERFGIEILGVVAKFNEGKDYILFRALDGPPVTRALGIAHGMSGSPIYINGRLVGAISMGIPGTQFARDPIALATPIEDMFDSWSTDLPKKPSGMSAAPPSQTGLSADFAAQGYSQFQPLDLPVVASGLSARSIARLNAHLNGTLAPYHFSVLAGGGAGGVDANTNPLARGASLVPGSAVGVSLVQGDVDLTATGTVTYRDGNRLLLFGHPFTSLGPIDAALTTAYVVSIFPSYQDSIKIGSPIKTVGRIFQDRPFAVGGVIGPLPQMVPMTVSVNDQSIHRRKDFHVRIINHPLLTGQFISQVADAAIAQVHGQPGDSVAQVSMDVDVEEIGHVRRTNVFYDALSIDQTAIGDLDNLMGLLSSNPFYPLAVKSVKMAVTIQNRHDTAEIDHLFVKQSHFAPGDTVDVGVVLKPYKRPPYTRTVSVKIPLNTPDGSLPLSVAGGGSGGGVVSLLGGLIQVRSSEPTGTAANVAQLVKNFTEKPRNNELVARLLLPTSAVTVQGEKLSGLPPTLASVMLSTRTTGVKTTRDEVKVTQAVPYIVSGSQTLSIMVRRKSQSESPRPAPAADPPATAAGAASPAPEADAPTTALSQDGTESGDAAMMLLPTEFDALASGAQAPAAARMTSTSVTVSAITVTPSAPTVTPIAPPTADTATDTAAATDTASTAVVKPVGRLPSVWRQNTQADFAAGTLKNVAVTSLGDIRLSPSLQKIADTTENYVWAMQPDGKGSVYLATGDGGMIYKMDASGKPAPFFKTGELEVTALAVGGDGYLYAGTAPNGRVFRVGPDGKGSIAYTVQEKYVTALAYDKTSDQLYIATGGGTGRVYVLHGRGVLVGVNPDSGDSGPRRIKVFGKVNLIGRGYPSQPLFTSPEANILALATDRDGNVYAGSGPDGIVYKIAPDGTSRVFYDAPEPNISALAVGADGSVYAGTTPTGTVYRISPDGSAKRLLGRAAPGVLSLKIDADGAVYAVNGGTVTKINPDETTQSFSTTTGDEQFLSLALDPTTSAVYAGTGSVGSVYKIGADAAPGGGLQGLFQSTVHDAGLRAQWGTLAWTADTPAGSSLGLETRSGDVERPDETWSAWSAPLTNPTGQTVQSPPARFIQYQAVMSGAGSVPKLRGVSLYYLPRNRPPTVSVSKPAGGDAVSHAALLQWSGSDPDKDTLAYDVSYSSDGGATWTPIKKRATPATAKGAPARAAESKANLDKLRNVPPAVRAQIAAQLKSDASSAAAPDDAARSKGNQGAAGLKELSFSWDTTEVPDGTYQIRVVASDKPSNPNGSLTAKAVSAPFLVANAKPTLTLGTPAVSSAAPDGTSTVTLAGTAATGLAFVKAVQGKADGGDSVAAAASDGLFDSPSEAFTLTLPGLAAGSHKITVETVDQAGNSATQTVTVVAP